MEYVTKFFAQKFILIADDNLDLATTLAMLLKLVGFEVETVHTGRDALTVAKKRKPDVLLLDIGLPDLNGYLVAQQFRNDSQLRDVFIIAISAYAPNTRPASSKTSDFDHYFVKPVDFQTLLPIINTRR